MLKTFNDKKEKKKINPSSIVSETDTIFKSQLKLTFLDFSIITGFQKKNPVC